MANIPGAISIEKASKQDDKNGIDWFVRLENGDSEKVDAKVRSQDYATRNRDDLALETWSVVEHSIPGWTRDASKQTDYVLWLWQDTGRWCLVSFRMLCAVFGENWETWRKKYKHSKQYTPSWKGREGWHSECVFVPRSVVWKAIYDKFGGKP